VSSLSIAARPGEPLAPWFSSERAGAAGVWERRFELSSFGDRVGGRCWRPEGTARGLVLAVHALGRDKGDPDLAAAAQVWARAGLGSAAIDLPLHGERHNAKLSRRAVAASAPGAAADLALWHGLVAQAVRDLARALDALATQSPLPPCACVGFADSAPIALAFASLDPRVASAAALGAARPIALELGSVPAKPLVWLARPDDLRLAR
jgi:hypothetical protein